jgi:hypothetical protein
MNLMIDMATESMVANDLLVSIRTLDGLFLITSRCLSILLDYRLTFLPVLATQLCLGPPFHKLQVKTN